MKGVGVGGASLFPGQDGACFLTSIPWQLMSAPLSSCPLDYGFPHSSRLAGTLSRPIIYCCMVSVPLGIHMEQHRKGLRKVALWRAQTKVWPQVPLVGWGKNGDYAIQSQPTHAWS